MGICLLIGAKQIAYAASAFTLTWTHSVEKTGWEEDWQVTPGGLEIVEARIAGTGAGMEPPADAVFDGKVWHYRPNLPPQDEVVLARSGATDGGWRICFDGSCLALPEPSGESASPMILRPCS